MVEHHHHAEEATMFPKIATFTKNASIMAGNLEQHEAFQEGLHKLHDYALNTKASTYNAAAVTKIIDSFAPALIKHLREEIDTFLALDKYDSQGLLKVWQESENAAKSTKNPHVFVSCSIHVPLYSIKTLCHKQAVEGFDWMSIANFLV